MTRGYELTWIKVFSWSGYPKPQWAHCCSTEPVFPSPNHQRTSEHDFQELVSRSYSTLTEKTPLFIWINGRSRKDEVEREWKKTLNTCSQMDQYCIFFLFCMWSLGALKLAGGLRSKTKNCPADSDPTERSACALRDQICLINKNIKLHIVTD